MRRRHPVRRTERTPEKSPDKSVERSFSIRGEYITLGQFLKVAGALESGGEVKSYLETNAVQINGEPESRRGRKLYPGDLIVVERQPPIRMTGGGDGLAGTAAGTTAGREAAAETNAETNAGGEDEDAPPEAEADRDV